MSSTPSFRLQPIVHVTNLEESLRFYETLGADVIVRNSDDDFALIRVGSSEIGLLAHPPNPVQSENDVELAFSCDTPLSDIETDMRSKGVRVARSATDEMFGEQLQIESPDGLLIKINRLNREARA